MPAKKASTSPVRDLAKLFDGTVAEWGVIVATIQKYRKVSLGRVEAALKKIIDAASSSATAEVDAADAQRVVGTRLAEHAQLVLAVFDALDGNRTSAAPITAPAAGPEKDSPLGDKGKFALDKAREVLAWIAYIKDVENWSTRDLEAKAREIVEREREAWDEVAKKLTGNVDATFEVILKAIMDLQSSKLSATPSAPAGNGELVWKTVAALIGHKGEVTKQKVTDALTPIVVAANRVPALEKEIADLKSAATKPVEDTVSKAALDELQKKFDRLFAAARPLAGKDGFDEVVKALEG